jgi:hypothetical protein
VGRFFWAGAERPLVRVAIHDPDPAGRPLLLGTTTLQAVQAQEQHLPGFVLPAAAFRKTAPLLRSDLFLTVDLSDLTLRYAR